MLHKSFATQILQCIAKSGFCVANCDAIPGKLCSEHHRHTTLTGWWSLCPILFVYYLEAALTDGRKKLTERPDKEACLQKPDMLMTLFSTLHVKLEDWSLNFNTQKTEWALFTSVGTSWRTSKQPKWPGFFGGCGWAKACVRETKITCNVPNGSTIILSRITALVK